MQRTEEKGLLARQSYDRDAALVHSDFESNSSDSDTESQTHRADRESVQHEDREFLDEAEQQEKLLDRPRRFDAVRDVFKHGARRETRRRRGGSEKTHNGPRGASELMFEMEEGFKDNSSQSSLDLDQSEAHWKKPSPPRSKRGKLALIPFLIVALLVGLVLGALKASHKRKPTKAYNSLMSNGTHSFKPTTILISLDGFRADFLDRGLTPAMNAFVASGVSPRYMLPSFPSVTFPNHFTLVTGLYPESHGIVSNQFWDPTLQEEFYYTQLDVSMHPKWWNAEPIWVTAEDQGVRTAVHMWPGSEAHIPDVEPTYLDKFNESEALTRKVDRLLHWLDLPDDAPGSDPRPQLLLAYVPNVDAVGHRYGPNSTEIRGTIADVDSMLTILVEGLYQRNLTEIVNLVIVSDHGMATTSNDRLIQLDDLIDMSLVDHIDGWPLRGLRLKDPERDVPILHKQLLQAAEQAGTFEVYTLETMPERYHFANNDRIAPLWVIPKTGWAIVEKDNFDITEAKISGKTYEPLGLHGYDHEHPLMRAIFIARGPAFPHPPNSRVSAFQNIEVYNIVCESLGIKPHPNNGTLHLPLKVEGLHSDANAPKVETPDDGPNREAVAASAISSSQSPTLSTFRTSAAQVSQTQTINAQPTQAKSQSGSNTTQPAKDPNWWKFLHDELQKAKDWAKQFVDSIKNNKPNTASDANPT